MVKCYICGKKFSNEEFYKHAKEKHGGIENTVYEIEEIKVEPNELQKYLEKIGYGIIAAEYDGTTKTLKMKKIRGVYDLEYYINVWDCRGILHLGKEEEMEDIGFFKVPKRLLKKFSKDEIEEICFEILEDRGGAINMSGIYYLDEEHVRKLEK